MRPTSSQRKHHYAIVDEVDSVLIDEADPDHLRPAQRRRARIRAAQAQSGAVGPKQRQAVNGFITEAKKKLGGGFRQGDGHTGGWPCLPGFAQASL